MDQKSPRGFQPYYNFFWIIFLKYKKIIVFLPILFVLLAFLISLNLQPIYKSTATLVIEPEEAKIINIEEVYSPESQFNRINNQIAILKSDEVIEYIMNNEDASIKCSNLFKATPDNFVKKMFQTFSFVKKTTDFCAKKNFKCIISSKNHDFCAKKGFESILS